MRYEYTGKNFTASSVKFLLQCPAPGVPAKKTILSRITDSTRSDYNAAPLFDVAPNLDKIKRGFRRKDVARAHSGLDFNSAR